MLILVIERGWGGGGIGGGNLGAVKTSCTCPQKKKIEKQKTYPLGFLEYS